MKKTLLILFLAFTMTVLAACGGNNSEDKEAAEGLLSDGKLVVGVTGGPHEEILGKVKELAEKEGLTIEIQVFNDYVMPNVALDEKDIDMNSMQTEPFFNVLKEERNLDLVKVADTVAFPMGIYSLKYKDVSELPDGAKIGLPGDPTNSGRALALFELAGLIKVKEGVDLDATVKDIEVNEHNFEFIELDSAQIPRQLDELDAAAINTNFAIEAGFSPAKDSIFIENYENSPFANLIAVRTENKDEEVVQQFIDIYHSEEVKKFIEENFDGSVDPSW